MEGGRAREGFLLSPSSFYASVPWVYVCVCVSVRVCESV